MTVGLELLSSGARAVLIDEAGTVQSRSEPAPSSDLATDALAALDALGPSSAPVAICSAIPESAAAVDATQKLVGRLGSRLVSTGLASGTAAVIAEGWIGAARGRANVVLLSAAEHTTAGILVDGRPFTGAHGRAALVGWLSLNPVEREDYRKLGCLEAEVGASGIVRRLVWRIKTGDASSVEQTVAGDLTSISVDQVLAASRQGDGVAISILRDTARYLGMAAANLVLSVDPEVLVLGGIMAAASEVFDGVQTELVRRLPPAMMQALTIVPAALGSDAAAIGAARSAAGR